MFNALDSLYTGEFNGCAVKGLYMCCRSLENSRWKLLKYSVAVFRAAVYSKNYLSSSSAGGGEWGTDNSMVQKVAIEAELQNLEESPGGWKGYHKNHRGQCAATEMLKIAVIYSVVNCWSLVSYTCVYLQDDVGFLWENIFITRTYCTLIGYLSGKNYCLFGMWKSTDSFPPAPSVQMIDLRMPPGGRTDAVVIPEIMSSTLVLILQHTGVWNCRKV